MKQCIKCGVTKPCKDFQKKATSPDGLTGTCKVCKRAYDNAYYKANPARKEYIRSNSDRRIAENRKWILEYLKSHPCVDCGETDPIVLEFDHREDKSGNLAVMTTRNSIPVLELEVAKCDVRCANCHRRKTAKDFGFWKIASFA